MYINLLGKRIAELRRNRNMTQYELGEIVEMSTSSIAMWELGKRDPGSQMLSTIARTFGVSVDYLLGQSNDIRGINHMSEAQPPTVIEFERDELVILLESLNVLHLSLNEGNFKTEVRDLRKRVIAVITGKV